ncbi:hypothetical protein P8C59_007239 [Phyllachora maydis]|uniref:Uncharacterized protein n=1 Tax=Phyllachora maydis TaxID=1825666 RepID=A0AAD9MFC1_9PEZI|nr:hypothetical protein P8C59_007239 [Phyllachora maydis]
MAHKLADLLAQDPSTTAFNYRQKITKLRINVEQIVAKTYKGKHLDLKSLVANVPRLRDLTSMVSAKDLTFIRQLHQTQAFSRLKKLSLVNYQLPTLLENNIEEAVATAKDEAYLQQVADAILALPNLDFLSIESSTIVNGYLLPLLPRNLKNITLINCWDVQADELSTFLLSHGSQVEHLTLHHNQSLSLAFVKTLGTACPRLKSLDMDFKYYNHHEFYHDGRPAYDHVLQEGDTPDWPSGIESIELRNARKWAPEAAEMLFRSLVDNATRFTKLRHLALKVMLDIPFRQRSEIREKWESKMKQVFLRRSADPMPFHSLRPSGEASAPKCRSKKRKSRDFSVPGQETRRSPRFKDMDNAGLASRASSCGRGRRLSARSRPSYVEPETDDDTDMEDAADADSSRQSSVSAGAAARSSNDGQEVVIQGLCDVVEVHIDNQKQTETVWAMSDFLDAESDDPTDSEWNGDQEAEESYAW